MAVETARRQSISGCVSYREKRIETQNTSWSLRDKCGSPDWRANLFSLFIDNLSRRVFRGALWDFFFEFGRVMDVFVSLGGNGNGAKETTYAFVRFKFKSELRKAIEGGNNKIIDGLRIKAKEASYGWSKHKVKQNHILRHQSLDVQRRAGYGGDSKFQRVNRSDKDVVLGNGRDSLMVNEDDGNVQKETERKKSFDNLCRVEKENAG
ncbi:hypothetical protein DITRI_Ditri07aG0172700 [Diplodiscus trichospermus]